MHTGRIGRKLGYRGKGLVSAYQIFKVGISSKCVIGTPLVGVKRGDGREERGWKGKRE